MNLAMNGISDTHLVIKGCQLNRVKVQTPDCEVRRHIRANSMEI